MAEQYDRGLIEGVQATVIKICHDVVIKCIGSMAYVLYAFSFGDGMSAGLQALLVLIIADFLTAITAAYQTGEHIKSGKIFRTVIKIVVYFLMISLGHMTEVATPILDNYITETILAFLAMTELISNLENIGRLGFSVPQKLLNKLRSERKKR